MWENQIHNQIRNHSVLDTKTLDKLFFCLFVWNLKKFRVYYYYHSLKSKKTLERFVRFTRIFSGKRRGIQGKIFLKLS